MVQATYLTSSRVECEATAFTYSEDADSKSVSLRLRWNSNHDVESVNAVFAEGLKLISTCTTALYELVNLLVVFQSTSATSWGATAVNAPACR